MNNQVVVALLLTGSLISGCSGNSTTPLATLPAESSPTSINASPTIELVTSITGDTDPLRLPIDVAFDQTGNFYVVDSANQRILKFNPDSRMLTKWGSAGKGNGEFNFMDGTDGFGGVATDLQGNVYVADTHNSRIQKFSSEGDFLLQWGSKGVGVGQFLSPLGIIIDQRGDVYVGDYERNDIQKFDGSGRFLLKWGSSGSADGQFDQLSYLAVDSQGDIYVADTYNDRIQKFSKEGRFLTKWGTFGSKDGELNRPYGVAVDAHDNVYVAEYKGNRVQKFSNTGRFLLKWGTSGSPELSLREPSGLKVSKDGYIYVVDYGNNRIQVFREPIP